MVLSSDEMITAVLSYLWLLVLIPYFMTQGKRTPFIVFHLKQGMALLVVWFVWLVVNLIVGAILPWTIAAMFGFVMWLIMIAFSILALIAWIKAMMGQQWSIPLISSVAEKIPVE